MDNLEKDISEIIMHETEKHDENGNPHFSSLKETDAKLISQIVSNFNLIEDFTDLPKKGDLIFVAAPTGAGKDTLVSKLKKENPEKNYVELNMDMFRHYYKYFENDTVLNDYDFANQTDEIAYEIYYTIQELILKDFPGTNVIITGTLRTTDWVEDVFKKFKENENTNYNVNISVLSVPKKDSQFSILKRYVKMVDYGVNGIDENGRLIYTNDFVPGTARYTSCVYHDETYNRFPKNIGYFLEKLQKGEDIDSINIYKRSVKEDDLDEDTLVKSYSKGENKTTEALNIIEDLRDENKVQIGLSDVEELFNVVGTKKNIKYFKSQKILENVLEDMSVIFDNPEFYKKATKLLDENDNIKE